MVNALSPVGTVQVVPYQSPKVSKADRKFNEKVFHDCQKNVKSSEVRDADWGLWAAQTCLAKDLVEAKNPEEAKLIVAKMNFIQTLINQNMDQDQDIYTKETKDKCNLIITKADAKAKVLPGRAVVIAAGGNAATEMIDSTAKLADSTINLVKTVKTPVVANLDLVA